VTDLPEQRPQRCHMVAEVREPEELCRFSSLRRFLRVSAWIWRWRARHHRSATGEIVSTSLLPEELEAARSRWIRVAQELSFRSELQALRAGKPLPTGSPLSKLAPWLDNEDILRVGGRLKHSILDADQRHLVILPPLSHVTYLVIDAAHRRTLHGGVQATLANIRQRVWIPRAHQLVRRYIHRCFPCVRWRAATTQPMMGNLPRTRVTPSRPFLHTGVDLAGPIWLRTTKGRGHKAYKGFLVVFVCFNSRGVHLEVVRVCLKGESTPPCRWPLARITRLHPGEDGQVRVVDVRTSVDELTRPVVKIVPLPTAAATDAGPPA